MTFLKSLTDLYYALFYIVAYSVRTMYIYKGIYLPVICVSIISFGYLYISVIRWNDYRKSSKKKPLKYWFIGSIVFAVFIFLLLLFAKSMSQTMDSEYWSILEIYAVFPVVALLFYDKKIVEREEVATQYLVHGNSAEI